MLSNPFTNQNRTTGQYFFYVADGRYDIRIAATGLATYTLTDELIGTGVPNVVPPQPPPTNPYACGPDCVYPQAYGAKADGVILGGAGGGTGCTAVSGSQSITCVNASFTAADIGKHFDLAHAGTPSCGPSTYGRADLRFNCNLVGTITGVASSSVVNLSTPLLSSVTNEQFAYASSDDVAIQAAIDSGAKTIALSGIYGITGSVTAPTLGNGAVGGVFHNRAIVAPGPGVGRLLRIGPVAWDGQGGAVLYVQNGSQNFSMTGVSIWGTNELGELGRPLGAPSHDGLLVCSGQPNNPVVCTNLPGNLNGNISNINFINCDFSYHWGVGWHVLSGKDFTGLGYGVYFTTISHSQATFNSNDGFNPNVTDNLIISAVNGSYNGTGGLEVNSAGSLSVTGSQFGHNKVGGVSIGGVTGGTLGTAPNHDGTCQFSGNDASENGNGYNGPSGAGSSTTGIGLTMGGGPQNCAVTGNTFRRNHLMGIDMFTYPVDQNYVISNNVFSSNGINGNTNPTSFGMWGRFTNATVTGNIFVDEMTSDIATIQRLSNVVTVTTTSPHNYNTGFTVQIFGTGTLDGTFMPVATIPDGQTFTFASTGADTPVITTGRVYSPTAGFTQIAGLGIQSCANSRFSANHSLHHRNGNIYILAGPFTNCLLSSDTNIVKTADADGHNGDILFEPGVTPTATGIALQLRDIQASTTACTTAAAPGATCTTTISNGSPIQNQSHVCSLNEGPIAQMGFPVILGISGQDTYTVTIGTFNGQAAGGGTLTCWTNIKY